jgi:predicted ABC-type ATPase
VSPVLIVIAGPNGSGKTTVTERLRADHWSDGVEYLNPDEVARDRFGDWNSPAAVLRAGSVALRSWIDSALAGLPRHQEHRDPRTAE